jgi:hypothetical protein
MDVIIFSLIKTTPLTFKVVRKIDSDRNECILPAFLVKDMIVTLVSGKWPLVDYNDCNKHTFVFQKEDGSEFSMLLSGFCWQCVLSTEKQQQMLDSGKNSIEITLIPIEHSLPHLAQVSAST